MKKAKKFLTPHACIRVMQIQGEMLSHYSSNDLVTNYVTFHFRFPTASIISAIIRFLESSAIRYRVTADINCAEQKYEMTITFKKLWIVKDKFFAPYLKKSERVDA